MVVPSNSRHGKPVPLLAPTYSFTGKDWWTPLMQTWEKMKDLEQFKGVDYMIPTLSKDSTGIIAGPSAADRALRWVKAALHRHWGGLTDPSIFAYPKDWHYETIQTDGAASPGSISSLSSGMETMDSVDTESDNEKTLGSAPGQLVPLPCSSASS